MRNKLYNMLLLVKIRSVMEKKKRSVRLLLRSLIAGKSFLIRKRNYISVNKTKNGCI